MASCRIRALALSLTALLATVGFAAGTSPADDGLVAHEDRFPPDGVLPLAAPPDEACVVFGGDSAPALDDCGMTLPYCVRNPELQHHARLFYVQTEGDPDEYDTVAPDLRLTLYRAAHVVWDEAMTNWGVDVRFKMLCDDDGQPTVTHVVMPRGVDAVAFLRDEDYAVPNGRAWMVEPHGGAWGGTPTDDSPGIDNTNNARWSYARVTNVGTFHERAPYYESIFLHELSHSLGAVQDSAPHANPGDHCNDGKDVMCYAAYTAPGTPPPCMGSCQPGTLARDVLQYAGYTPVTLGCVDKPRYDCNHDDYFNLEPEPGSYLDTHWNLGSPDNLFFRFSTKADPVAAFDGPEMARAGVPVLFDASSSHDPDGTVAWYEWDFGDGTTSGPLARPTVEHAYATGGDYEITLAVYDDYEGDDAVTHPVRVVGRAPPGTA